MAQVGAQPVAVGITQQHTVAPSICKSFHHDMHIVLFMVLDQAELCARLVHVSTILPTPQRENNSLQSAVPSPFHQVARSLAGAEQHLEVGAKAGPADMLCRAAINTCTLLE